MFQKEKKIPVPFRLMVRNFAQTKLPAIVFGSTLIGVGLMWRNYISPVAVQGADELKLPPRPALPGLQAGEVPAASNRAVHVEFQPEGARFPTNRNGDLKRP